MGSFNGGSLYGSFWFQYFCGNLRTQSSSDGRSHIYSPWGHRDVNVQETTKRYSSAAGFLHWGERDKGEGQSSELLEVGAMSQREAIWVALPQVLTTSRGAHTSSFRGGAYLPCKSCPHPLHRTLDPPLACLQVSLVQEFLSASHLWHFLLYWIFPIHLHLNMLTLSPLKNTRKKKNYLHSISSLSLLATSIFSLYTSSNSEL